MTQFNNDKALVLSRLATSYLIIQQLPQIPIALRNFLLSEVVSYKFKSIKKNIKTTKLYEQHIFQHLLFSHRIKSRHLQY